METIDDIVKEILKEVRESERNNPDKTTRIFLTSSNMALKDFACRAKKAYKFMVEGLNGGIVARDKYIEKLTNENVRLKSELNKDDCLKLANDVDRLRAENEQLKAALQPVLDCDVTKESYLAQSEVVWIAQRIWKEGEK